jgi:hypothetical protein
MGSARATSDVVTESPSAAIREIVSFEDMARLLPASSL